MDVTITSRKSYLLGMLLGSFGGFGVRGLVEAWEHHGWRPWYWDALIAPLAAFVVCMPLALWRRRHMTR